jgi:hypothetical protein
VWLMTVAYRMFQKSLYRERWGRLNKFIFDHFILFTLVRNICHFVGYTPHDIKIRNYSYCWQYTNFCPHPSSNSVSEILCIWCKSLGFLRETLFSWCAHRKSHDVISRYRAGKEGRGNSHLYHAVRVTTESGYWGHWNIIKNTFSYLRQWNSGPHDWNARKRKGSMQKHALTGLEWF